MTDTEQLDDLEDEIATLPDGEDHPGEFQGMLAERLTKLFEQTTRPDGRRWTLQYVADQCAARGQQVTKAYILHLRAGQRTEPRMNLIEALADVFGVPVTYFTGDKTGRITADLLPLLAAMNDPRVRALVNRADLGDLIDAASNPDLGPVVSRRDLTDIIAELASPDLVALLHRDDLLQVVQALTAPELRAMIARPDLVDVLGAVGDYRVQTMIETALADPMTVRVVPRG